MEETDDDSGWRDGSDDGDDVWNGTAGAGNRAVA